MIKPNQVRRVSSDFVFVVATVHGPDSWTVYDIETKIMFAALTSEILKWPLIGNNYKGKP